MEENQDWQLKCLIVVQSAEELELIYENMVYVEYVLEKKLMLESYQGLENLVGRKKKVKNINLI